MLDGQVEKSKYPLKYHITPTEGLLNDPNGLCFYKGLYHVFYQWNPKGVNHKNKSWGHVSSKNLVDWSREPVALTPSEWYDKDGIYSGSAAVIDEELYLFYTGTVVQKDGSKKSYQCIALSNDGVTFKKLGPVIGEIEGYTRHVRDPKVWYNEAEKCWNMILGAQSVKRQGTILRYASLDLKNWEKKDELLKNEDIEKLEQRGYMWECPDLFFLNGNWILLYSPQGINQKNNQFANVHQTLFLCLEKTGADYQLMNSEMKELDWGFEFYAPQTFKDPNNRRILFGWAGIMTNEMEQSMPTIDEKWVHTLTIPRELFYRDDKLIQKPIEELKQLRKSLFKYPLSNRWIHNSGHIEQELVLNFDKHASNFCLFIKKTTSISYNSGTKEFCLERLNWLTKESEQRKTKFEGDVTQLQLLIDGSCLELFINEGESVATARFFEEGPMEVIYVGANEGDAQLYHLD